MSPKKPRGTTARKQTRAADHAGLRAPEQRRGPDLRHPRVRAAIRREGALLAQHPENAAIDAWIEAIYDWSEWR